MSRAANLLLVVGCWAAIYLPALGTLEIKGEEGRRILPAVAMLKTGNWLVPQVGSEPYFRKPPLVNWLVAASFKMTGYRNEWTARLPSVLCALAVALVFITVARASLGPNGSLIAALIWMVNFGMIEKGRLIEIEALYVSLFGLGLICWLSWWQQRRSPWLIWLGPSEARLMPAWEPTILRFAPELIAISIWSYARLTNRAKVEQNGILPPAERPAATENMFCSAILHSKKRGARAGSLRK